MNQVIKQTLLVQAIVLISTCVFANMGTSLPIPSSLHYLSLHSNLSGKDTLNNTKPIPTKTLFTESMVSFNAGVMKNAIDLRWNMANGNNNDVFFVERSVDGSNFEKVGEVKGNLVSVSMSEYGFTDFVKPAVSRKNDLYYRLKQIGSDNTFTYSKVLIVRMYNSKSVTAVSVTPDPSLNDILVNVQLKENSFVVMTVKDNNGNQIMRKAGHADLGANTFSLEGTSKLEPGNYQLEVIINSNERMTMQLIKG